MVPSVGIEPTSQPFQGSANPSQLPWQDTCNLEVKMPLYQLSYSSIWWTHMRLELIPFILQG